MFIVRTVGAEAADQIARLAKLVWPGPLIASVTDEPILMLGLLFVGLPLLRVIVPAASGLGDGLRERLYRWARGSEAPEP